MPRPSRSFVSVIIAFPVFLCYILFTLMPPRCKVSEMSEPFCLWLYGPAGSGKSTLGRLLAAALQERGIKTQFLDEDNIRSLLNLGLSGTQTPPETFADLVTFIAGLLLEHGVPVVAASSDLPRFDVRANTEWTQHSYLVVTLECPEDIRATRSSASTTYPKGADRPVASPARPDMLVRTGEEWPDQSRDRVLRGLETLKIIPATPMDGYTAEEKLAMESQLKDLGYL